jgi:hypothetical protein
MNQADISWAKEVMIKLVGKEKTEILEKSDSKILRKLAAEMAAEAVQRTESDEKTSGMKKYVSGVIENIRNGTEDDEERKKSWELKRELEKIIEDFKEEEKSKELAVNWSQLWEAGRFIDGEWASVEEVMTGIAILARRLGDGGTAGEMMEKWFETKDKEEGEKKEKIKFLLEMAADLGLIEKYDFEVINGVVCFYKKEDKYRYLPVVSVYPGLSGDEIGKIEEVITVGLPRVYRDFLGKANGMNIGQRFFWWGIRKVYSEEKHLEQYGSLVNSPIDRSLEGMLTSTEVVIASDRNRNIWSMDVVSGEISGLIRPNGDEMATPIRKKYPNLGELFKEQLEEAEKSRPEF